MSRTSGIRFELATYVGVVLLLAAICPRTYAQEGFLSIDCGYTGPSPYFDDLGLSWVSDSTDNYTRTGVSMSVKDNISSSAYQNSRALAHYRYFPNDTARSKYCYELLVSSGDSSLLRSTFFLGSTSGLVLPISFDVYINGSCIYTVEVNSSTVGSPLVYEVVFFSPGPMIHFCLLPTDGTPFISTIEIRALRADNTSLYLPRDNGKYLYKRYRVNCGSNYTVRYPDDKYDRIWDNQTIIENYQLVPSTTVGAVSYISNATVNNVPSRVMAEAWESDQNTFFFIEANISYSDPTPFYAIAYIEELNATSPIRMVNISVNGRTKVINASRFPQEASFMNVQPFSIDPRRVVFNFTASAESTSGPIVNAFELYLEAPFNNSTTDDTDVDALGSLKTSLNLMDWQGDPCLPVPWNWVVCDDNVNSSSRRVTKILLSDFNISGTFPSSLSQLAALTEIRLDNNKITGPVSPSLASLPNLAVLSINNNKLTGRVPEELKTKTGLNFTYYDNDFSKSKSLTAIIAGPIAAGIVLLSIVLAIVLICLRKRRKPSQGYKPAGADVTLKKVLTATNNYARVIGVGSYGSVYHGNLDGKEVAVKVNGINSDRSNQEFITEVDILTRVHHKNLVSLLGYCSEEQHLILIYEYQTSGTLREWLYSCDSKTPTRGFLDWPQRLRIAVDAAKGLEYLHRNCVPPIIHRDVKSSNILLDADLVGKVADFGVSKTKLRKMKPSGSSFGCVEEDLDYNIETDTGKFFTNVKGTFGYLDPEYVQTQILSPTCDVYSFGVVLAELISGQPAIRRKEDGTLVLLQAELHRCVETNALETFADPNLKDDFDSQSWQRVANIALACIRLNGAERPDISEVVRSLEMADPNVKDGLQSETSTYSTPGPHVSSSYPNTGSEGSTSSFRKSSSYAPNPHSLRWGSVAPDS